MKVLEHVSLATSIDQDWEGEKINMMTMHAAKGLGIRCCFCQDGGGFISHQKSIEEKGQNGLEEVRLAYVELLEQKR